MTGKRYRVAQWATGHSGLKALEAVIQHPSYDLVACYVYSEAKVGRDAGELCGLAPTGVLATRSIDEVLATQPDVVLYMPMSEAHDPDNIVQLLGAGVNVCTIVADEQDYRNPATLEAELRQQIEQACEKGQSTLYATGPSPGWITEQFPLAVLANMRRLDCMTIYEYADLSIRNSPEMLDRMFKGNPADKDLSKLAGKMAEDFGSSFRQISTAIGLPVDSVTGEGRVLTATQETVVRTTTIDTGEGGAWSFEITGWRDGKPLMKFCPTWYITNALEPLVPVRSSGWKVVFEGDPPFEIDIYFEKSELYSTIQPGYNAYILVNAIPNVVAAAPGTRTTVELPPIVPLFS